VILSKPREGLHQERENAVWADNACLGNIDKFFPWSGFASNPRRKGNPLLSGTERLVTHFGKIEGIEWLWNRKFPRIRQLL
jgi:hypothetical protein